jgi:uncharacterized membrane protein (DUF485 family)
MSNPLVKFGLYNVIAAFLGALFDAVIVTAVLFIQTRFYPGSVTDGNVVYFLGWGIAWLWVLKACYVIEAYVEYRKHTEMEALGLMNSRRPRRPAGDIDANGDPM